MSEETALRGGEACERAKEIPPSPREREQARPRVYRSAVATFCLIFLEVFRYTWAHVNTSLQHSPIDIPDNNQAPNRIRAGHAGEHKTRNI